MGVRHRHNFPLILFFTVIFASHCLSLKCRKCSLSECSNGPGRIEECSNDKTDCATSILKRRMGPINANSVLERYCYAPTKRNRAYKKNTPHCQRNDRANVEICVCQGDLCNDRLPPCRLRHYGRGKGCSP